MHKSRDYFFVTVQLLLFALYVWQPLDGAFPLPEVFRWVGAVLQATGVVLALWPVLQLKTRLTMLPTPVKHATLITTGAFTYIRHPIYSGIFLFTLGYGIFVSDYYRIAIACALLLLFYFKSNYEEMRLMQRFPDYAIYRLNTKKFFPFIL